MLLESFTSEGMPGLAAGSLRSPRFCSRFFDEVVTNVFGVEESHKRPAEYAIVPPIELVKGMASEHDKHAVHVRLSGVSTHGRPLKMLHGAAKALHSVVVGAVAGALKEGDDPIQVFCYVQCDNPVETWPGSGKSGNLIEHPAEWVSYKGAEASSEG